MILCNFYIALLTENFVNVGLWGSTLSIFLGAPRHLFLVRFAPNRIDTIIGEGPPVLCRVLGELFNKVVTQFRIRPLDYENTMHDKKWQYFKQNTYIFRAVDVSSPPINNWGLRYGSLLLA
jgi:hypothetical protein